MRQEHPEAWFRNLSKFSNLPSIMSVSCLFRSWSPAAQPSSQHPLSTSVPGMDAVGGQSLRVQAIRKIVVDLDGFLVFLCCPCFWCGDGCVMVCPWFDGRCDDSPLLLRFMFRWSWWGRWAEISTDVHSGAFHVSSAFSESSVQPGRKLAF